MGKAYLLAIFLLAASFSGCLDSSDNSDDSEETDSGNKPIATIVSITPNPVNTTTLEKNGVAFVGLGNPGNGYIREYDWGSSIDGFLSSEKEFTTKSLSEGNHTIFFKVLNDENVWSDKATATLQVLNQTEDSEEEIIREWDFFAIEVDHHIVANLSNHVAIGIANLGNRSADFNVSFDSDYPLHFLEYSSDFTVSEGGTEVELSLEPGVVRILILEINSTSDFNSANISANLNWDGGSSSKSISLYFNYVPKGERVEVGNTTYSYYSGFLERNGKLFDSNIEDVWDNYGYFMEGMTSANRHTATLPADNIGCNGEGDPSENCEGGRQMIRGFDQGMVGMYVNQTIYVVIPPEDAYGKTGSSDLSGETLIFSIRIISVE